MKDAVKFNFSFGGLSAEKRKQVLELLERAKREAEQEGKKP